jgi:hypothetical protein
MEPVSPVTAAAPVERVAKPTQATHAHDEGRREKLTVTVGLPQWGTDPKPTEAELDAASRKRAERDALINQIGWAMDAAHKAILSLRPSEPLEARQQLFNAANWLAKTDRALAPQDEPCMHIVLRHCVPKPEPEPAPMPITPGMESKSALEASFMARVENSTIKGLLNPG